MAPLGVLQGIYAKYFGLSLSTIAIVILCARLFDAVSDPLMGYYCDQFHRRSGTRKPFILIGGLVFIISSYFLYVPFGVQFGSILDAEPSMTLIDVSTMYFAGWFFVFYLGFTFFDIPHITWGGELASNASDKAIVYSYRSIAGYLGILLFYTVPMLPIFKTANITPATLQVSVISAGVLMVFFLVFCLKRVPNNCLSNDLIPKNTELHYSSLSKREIVKDDEFQLNGQSIELTLLQKIHLVVQHITENKPFLIFIVAFLLSTLGAGMWYGLVFFYVDVYLDMGEKFAPTFILSSIAGVVATPVWCRLAICLGKKCTWLLAMSLIVTGFSYTGTLSPSETHLGDLIILQILVAVGYSCITIIAPTMVSEITDYGTWKSNVERSATYFALYTFIIKTAMGISSAMGIGIAGWYGFDATAAIQTQHGAFGITLAIAWLPAVFAISSLIMIALNPINERHHRIIRQRLDIRKERAV